MSHTYQVTVEVPESTTYDRISSLRKLIEESPFGPATVNRSLTREPAVTVRKVPIGTPDCFVGILSAEEVHLSIRNLVHTWRTEHLRP